MNIYPMVHQHEIKELTLWGANVKNGKITWHSDIAQAALATLTKDWVDELHQAGYFTNPF